MAPIEATGSESKTGVQVRPEFVVFQTPPPTEPKQKVVGSPGTPETALARPPRGGPTLRQRRAEKRLAICRRADTRGSQKHATSAQTHDAASALKMIRLTPSTDCFLMVGRKIYQTRARLVKTGGDGSRSEPGA